MTLSEVILIVCGILFAFLMLVVCSVCVYDSRLKKKREEMRVPCPKCGSKKDRIGCFDVSGGYQYQQCGVCGHCFQETDHSVVRAGYCSEDEDGGCHMYTLRKPKVNEDGEPIENEVAGE